MMIEIRRKYSVALSYVYLYFFSYLKMWEANKFYQIIILYNYAINRTRYAATSQEGHVGRRVRPQMAGEVKETAQNADGPQTISNPWWGPDPIAGYYRPVDWEAEIDPSFHQMAQNHKIKQTC